MAEITTQPEADTAGPAPAGWLKYMGPGLVTGASDDDPSGIGTYAQAGALFGTGQLWVMLFSFPLMAVVQITCARVARVTGRGLAANLAKVMPRWLLMPLLLLLVLVNAVNIGADLAAMGEATTLLLPGGKVGYVLLFGIVSVVVEVVMPYSRYVKVLKWLSLSLLAYVATTFMVHVPWGKVLHDTVMPQIHWSKEYTATLVAVLGTTISPYLFFWQSAQEVEEQRACAEDQPLKDAPEQAPRQLRMIRADTISGMAVSNSIGYFMMLTFAATIGSHGSVHVDSAAQAAQALKPLAGHAAELVFTLGIIGTGLLAIPVMAGSAGYALAEAFAWKRGLERRPAAAPRFYGVIALSVVLGIALAVSHVNPMRALVISAVLNGIVAVPLLAALVLVAARPAVMGEFATGRFLRAFGWLATFCMGAAAVAMLFA
jgi:NRAMP (natural resistance-associated macrophage protein)-like metal ion transporter